MIRKNGNYFCGKIMRQKGIARISLTRSEAAVSSLIGPGCPEDCAKSMNGGPYGGETLNRQARAARRLSRVFDREAKDI
jgi:hypothetical protein